MQIEKVVLYSRTGVPREVDFRLGQLNVITGDSQTGKSSLTNIIRYCLGSSRPDVPFGPISDTVAWYGLIVRIGTRRLFLGRPAADGAGEVSAAMLLVEPEGVPSFDALVPNTTAGELQEYLAASIGIEENLNVPAIGQTRAALAANFVHSLYYCSKGKARSPTRLFSSIVRIWSGKHQRSGTRFRTSSVRKALTTSAAVSGSPSVDGLCAQRSNDSPAPRPTVSRVEIEREAWSSKRSMRGCCVPMKLRASAV
jgi:hypothetical protein